MLALGISAAQEFMAAHNLAGWLIHDYRHSNPIFWQVVGGDAMTTRPCFLFVPRGGDPVLVTHHVDAGRFRDSALACETYRNRQEMVDALKRLLPQGASIAMEYSPQAALPRASRIDAGTLELVRGLGVEVVSSADLFQYATQRWSREQLHSHLRAAGVLGRTVVEAFQSIAASLPTGASERQVAEFIRRRYEAEGLTSPDGPVVAVNAHSSDPHYEPSDETNAPIGPGDWVLIDLWAKDKAPDGVYADITWVGYVGKEAPTRHLEVWNAVAGARDAALRFLQDAHRQGRALQGWEVDQAARDYIAQRGYGDYFTHRLGHSIGYEVHGDGVNLDSWETHETRTILPGVAFSVEPGVYLLEFGVRSEIDVFFGADGPRVTTLVQRDIVLIGA